MSDPDTERLVALLERLVAFDTQNPPGQEAAAAAMLVEVLRGCGMDAEVRPVAPGRANAVAMLRNGPGPVVAFNSHIDTVPVGTGWASDPLRLVERGENLFGRGACSPTASTPGAARWWSPSSPTRRSPRSAPKRWRRSFRRSTR
jgi:acetylornithine deacetylase/succinyl-diaminopimelate desuccinylase-like protein